MTKRTLPIRLAALASLAALTAVACGDDDDGSGVGSGTGSSGSTTDAAPTTAPPIDTAPSSVPGTSEPPTTDTVPDPTQSPTTPATDPPPSSPPPTTEPPSTEPGRDGALAEAASVDEIVAATETVFGPTDDAVGTMAPFVGVPGDIPTPKGANVFDFSVSMYPAENNAYYSAEVYFTADGTPEDLSTFYEAELAAAGYTPTGSSDDTQGDLEIRRLEFEIPRSRFAANEVAVSVIDGPDTDWVELLVADTLQDEWLARIDAWPGDVPGGQDPETADARVATAGSGGANLRLEVNYLVPGTEASLTKDVKSALPTELYKLDPATPPSDGVFNVRRQGFESVQLYIGDFGVEGAARLGVLGDIAIG